MQVKTKYKGKKIHAKQCALKIWKEYKSNISELDKDKEHFFTISLDAADKIKAVELVGIGTSDCVLTHPREVFRSAIVNSASSVICFHNHPSGDLRPSDDDDSLSRILFSAGELIQIPLKDHIIVSDKKAYSCVDNNRLRFIEIKDLF